MLGFVTREQIAEQVKRALLDRIREEEEMAKNAQEAGVEFKRKYHPKLLETNEYKRWVDERCEDHRKRGLLVSAQQLADIHKSRRLMLGDRVRYIGPDRLEDTRVGRSYNRPHGQEGAITKAIKGSDELYVYTFMPVIPQHALDPNGPTVFVAQLMVKERTPGYFELERIPEENES